MNEKNSSTTRRMNVEKRTHVEYIWPLASGRRFHFSGAEVDAEFIEAAFKDAERYRKVRHGQHWSVSHGTAEPLRGEALDAVLDAMPGLTEGDEK